MEYSPELEQGLLASILRYPDSFSKMYDILKPEQFGWRAFGHCWEAFKALEDSGLKIDAVTLGDQLDRMRKLKDFSLPGSKVHSGRIALSKLKELRTTKDTAETYAYQIIDYHAKRELKRIYAQAINQSMNGRSASDIILDVNAASSKLTLYSKAQKHTYDSEEGADHAKIATETAQTGVFALNTYIVDLDSIITPLREELITLAALRGEGKTSLVASIAVNSARHGLKWHIFSLEGGMVKMYQRILSQLSGVEAWRIMHGKLTDEEWQRYYAAIKELKTLPIRVTDIPAIKIGQIRTEVRKYESDIVAVDYVQLAEPDGKNQSRTLDIGEITRGLKALATELNIIIYATAQINREVEKRTKRRPMLSDLKESSSIEEDSDTVVFIHKPDLMNQNATELIVAKHRNGKTGSCNVWFNEKLMRFQNSSTEVISVRDHTV